jgi:biotin transporter BioY
MAAAAAGGGGGYIYLILISPLTRSLALFKVCSKTTPSTLQEITIMMLGAVYGMGVLALELYIRSEQGYAATHKHTEGGKLSEKR